MHDQSCRSLRHHNAPARGGFFFSFLKKAPLMRLMGLLYSVLWLEVDSNGSSAVHWIEMNHLLSVPRWWCHWGHVSDTRQQQWHVDPTGFGAWPDSWLVQVGSDRTDTFVRPTNTQTHAHGHTITQMPKPTEHIHKSYLRGWPGRHLVLFLFFSGAQKDSVQQSSELC